MRDRAWTEGQKSDMHREGFEKWRDSLPEKHWAKYDLSACKLGFDAGHEAALAAQGQGDGLDMRKYVRHLADVLEAGVGLWKVDADLQRLAAAINANLPAPPSSPAGAPDPTVLYTVEEVAEAQETLRKHNRTLMGEVIDQMIDVLLAAAPSAAGEE